MKRLGLILFVCTLVVGLSFFLTRERDLAQKTESGVTRPSTGPAGHEAAVSGIAKRERSSRDAGLPDITAADMEKAKVLDEILRSKNDNDPRLDHDFNSLSEGAKVLLRSRYAAYAPERRNERGTIVFLLGRNMSSETDVDFFRSVLGEPACLSLSDCAKDSTGQVDPGSSHLEMGGEVTLAYPQLVALKSLERYLTVPSASSALTAAALRELTVARSSPVAKVSAMAEEILARYSRHRKSGG